VVSLRVVLVAIFVYVFLYPLGTFFLTGGKLNINDKYMVLYV